MTKFAKVLFSVLLVLVLTVPNNSFYSIFDVDGTGLWWLLDYIFMFIDYLPLFVLWVLYLLIRSIKIKDFLYVLLFIYSGLLIGGSALVHVIPVQDYAPTYGVYIGLLFFPVLVVDNLYRRGRGKVTSKCPE